MILTIATNGPTPTDPTGTIDAEPDTVPYLQRIPPYNRPPMPTPTTTSNGGVVHPSVWDSTTGWNGHRYWMGITDYGTGHTGENPFIMASDDGYTWEWPAGLTNPISTTATQTPALTGGGFTFNSDTELVHDPATNKLHLFWRQYNDNGDRIYRTESTNGSTWTTPVIALDSGFTGNFIGISPCIWQNADNTWSMWALGMITTGGSFVTGWKLRTATTPDGTWSAPAATTGHGGPWHTGVWRDPDTGTLYGAGSSTDYIWAMTSTDNGTTWTKGNNILGRGGAGWDNMEMYRTCLQPHPNSTDFRVWYSAQSTTAPGWRAAYTIIPRNAWPT